MLGTTHLKIMCICIIILCTGCGGGGSSSGGGGSGSGGGTANTPPIFTSGNSSSVTEGQTSTGYIATATDADGDSISYSINGGDDAALFSINAASGALSFISAPDFGSPSDGDTNNSYQVNLQASDGTAAVTLSVVITVNETNSAPKFSNDYLARIPFACSDASSVSANTTDELPKVSVVSAEDFLSTGVLLGRPTSSSISVSILPVDSITDVRISYATDPDAIGQIGGSETTLIDISACDTTVVELTGLLPNTQYFYRISYVDVGGSQITGVSKFHTARATGQRFSFAVNADPHLGSLFRFDVTHRHPDLVQQNENASEEMYAVTLSNSVASGADFMIDLGDTFMTEKNENQGLYQTQYEAHDANGGTGDIRDNPMTEAEVRGDYAYIRSLFAQAAHSLPLFLTVGNHEIEVEKYLGQTSYEAAAWGNNARKKQFPVPTACSHETFQNNEFYLGETTDDANLTDNIGGNNCHDSYYAWQWGDALFIVLDPMWQSADISNTAPRAWGKSLGLEQYDWLKQTLEEKTDVPFKFVFMHNMVGGLRNGSGSERSGALLANYYEWGGCTEKWVEELGLTQEQVDELVHPEDFDVDGNCTNEFSTYRPDWGDREPIQEVLLDHNVQIVFKGHDHLYVREQHPNGLIYQTLPQPSVVTENAGGTFNRAADYHYDVDNTAVPTVDTVVDANSGFLYVTVNAGAVDGQQTVGVEYRKSVSDTSCLDGSAACYTVDGDVKSSYRIDASSNLFASGVDSDGDGAENHIDAFPNDPDEILDSDNDGIGDNSDATPNGEDSLGLEDIVLRESGAPVTADFYAPKTLNDKMSTERTTSWTQITTPPENLTRFSFGEAGTTDVLALTDAAGSIDGGLSIETGLAANTSVSNDMLLRSMFQFVELSTGEFAIYSTKHGNYAIDVAANGTSLVLRDVRSHEAFVAQSGSFLTFNVGTSPLSLVANGRYHFDTVNSVDTDEDNNISGKLVFAADPLWTDKEVVLNGPSLELTASGGTLMNLYEATIGLEIPYDFNPQERDRFPNPEFWDTSKHDAADRIQEHIDSLNPDYSPQVSSPGANPATLAAVNEKFDEIETDLAAQGSQTRYPREFYLALRDGMLRRQILAEESTDGRIGDLIVPYVYFTHEMDNNGNYHPYMVINTHGVPDALGLLGDIPHPPGDGFVQGYENQNVTRSYYLENFILGIPMRDYGEVSEVTENNLEIVNTANQGRTLASDRGIPPSEYDHHNYASTNESAVAVDGVVVFPSYNASLNFSQEPGELSVRGMHAGRGLGIHYHADPQSAAFSDSSDNTDTGLNLYNESDYVGRNHPPIISIGFDGVAGYGFYQSGGITSDGVNNPLDEFGGHEHDDYGYHYHVLRTPNREVDISGGVVNEYTTHELGPLGAWAGRLTSLPADGFRPRNNTLWVDGQ